MRQDAFERLYEAEAEALLAFLVYRTGDVGLAEDVLADTFERVLRAGARFDPRRASEKTWLYTIALNRLRDLRRRQAAEQRALERLAPVTPGGEVAALDALGERDAVVRALRGLSEEERESVALRYGAALGVGEIARLLGVPPTTVKGRLHRGLEKLRAQLG